MNLFKNKTFLILLFCFFVSFFVLMIASKSSFLYPLNDWGDANAFFTMGKSLFEGKVIFKDLFEQKGPVLYLIYGIGYLISNKSFLGVFFLEVISSTIFLFYTYKIISLYLKDKYSYLILPFFAYLIYTSVAFRHGASCEEFCFPLLMYTLYQLLIFARNKDISYLKIYIVGIVAGLIFLMKYIVLGVSFAFAFYLFFSYIFHKKYKKAFLFPFVFLAGMLTPIIPWIIYFLANGALYDFLNTYILINLTSYGATKTSFFTKLINCPVYFARNLLGAYLHVLIAFLCIGFFLFKKKIISFKEKCVVVCVIFWSVIFTYIGGVYIRYYVLPILIFIVFAFIGLFIRIKKAVNLHWIVYSLYFIGILVLSYFTSPNTYMLGQSRKDLVQYQFADIILQEEDAKILNYGALDMGFYTVTGIVPDTKYFHKLNFNYSKYPENVDSLNSYIRNKEIDFVIFIEMIEPSATMYYPVEPYLNVNYEVIDEATQMLEGAKYKFSLYKLREESLENVGSV